MKFGSSAARPYVAAFRAYKWNADIASLAERFFGHCPGARHVVLLNEEGGSIDVGAWEKVSHTQDFSEWGLPERPHGQSPWYNGDYTYILLRQRLPDHDHYLVVESDVAVNLPLGPMVEGAAAREIDAVVHHLSPVHPDWLHHAASLAQPDAWRCFLFTALFSGRALDTLLAARLDLARHPEAASRPWPIVESSFRPRCATPASASPSCPTSPTPPCCATARSSACAIRRRTAPARSPTPCSAPPTSRARCSTTSRRTTISAPAPPCTRRSPGRIRRRSRPS